MAMGHLKLIEKRSFHVVDILTSGKTTEMCHQQSIFLTNQSVIIRISVAMGWEVEVYGKGFYQCLSYELRYSA